MIAGVRGFVGEAAERFTDEQIIHLVDLTKSVGLACDALCMAPQPKFLDSL